MKKRSISILCVSFIVLHIVAQDAIGQSVIVLVNASRYAAGISNLIVSTELNAAAQRHSNNMAAAGQLDHVGSDGSQFWERMIDAGYSLTTGAENILLRSDTNAQAVFNQWWNSPSHRTNMMNAEYVEIGLAYARAGDGTYYFTMVLGTRDGVSAPPIPSPTIVPPTSTPIPPTYTPIPPTLTHTPLPSATFTATPLIPPTRTLSPLITPFVMTPLPTGVPTNRPTATPILPPDIRLVYDIESLTLINISGRRLDLSQLEFRSDAGEMSVTVWNTEFLTDPLNNFTDNDCLQVWGLELNRVQDKPSDCEVRHGWIAVSNSQLFWQNASSFYVMNDGDVIGQCDVVDRQCDLSLEAELTIESKTRTPIVSDRDIRLIFNQNSLTILNIADTPLDIRGLLFRSTTDTLAIEEWNSDFLTTSLGGVPSGDCLMAWTSDSDGEPTPLECDTRHGWVVADDDQDFWREVSRFEVVRDNRVLAGCVVVNGFCDVKLAGNLGTNSPTLAPPNPVVPSPVTNANVVNSSGGDLTFVYDLESFAVVNLSGQSLDITALVFESDSGVFAATRWNTDFLTSSLSDFPSGDCLQIWGVNEQLVAKPSLCNARHGWIAVSDDLQFWRNISQFRVRFGADQIGTCRADAGICTVNFP